MTFKSTALKWLVIDRGEKNALFHGVDTINCGIAPDRKSYRFLIWTGDDRPDTFRIKIWWDDASGEHVIYDCGQQAIKRGSIVIHAK